jgi:D-cysteine desulfhydrase
VSATPRWPLLERFPALAALPRVELRSGPTPVESLTAVTGGLWIKRDDLTALPIGGNKVRSLEFLLGGIRSGNRVATVGSVGSTHALATAVYARALDAATSVGLWPQEMNPVAERVSEELARVATSRRVFPTAAVALPWLWWRARRGDRAVPAGGTSPLGILGHVNAALELANQVRQGLAPEPKRIVVPLGSGGTAAGLMVGFAIAGIRPTIVGARVVPKIVGRKGRVRRLARATLSLIERWSGERLSLTFAPDVVVADGVYGGGYGRPLGRAEEAARELRGATGLQLDGTYAAKAFVAALDSARTAETLFWLTFDARWMGARTVI